MQKVLLISTSSALEDRLGDLLDSPRHVARVTSWNEAHRLLTRTTPAAVLVGTNLADPAHASEIVRLNNVLGKDGKPAYLMAEQANGQIGQWTEMFDAVEDIITPPSSAGDWASLGRLLEPHLDDEESGDDGPSESSPASSQPIEVMVRLPEIKSGSLQKLSLTRLLYCLHSRQATGTLLLRSGKMERNFAFADGRFVTAPNHHDIEALTSAYAWEGGQFEFQPRHGLSGAPQSTYEIMINGLTTHRGQRQLMDGLMSRMQTYPVVTQLWGKRSDKIDWNVLQTFLQLVDGQRTLESIFSQLGSQITDAFRCAVFARDTDLIVFRADETARGIAVEYDHATTATTSTEPSSAPTKIERATGSERQELITEMREFLDSTDSMSAHELFGVWEGCGREVVKETYYAMIKEHHPDAYGGNVATEIRDLAQRTFIKIRQAYTKLMKVEKEQTVPPPDPDASPRKSRRDQVSTLQFSASEAETVNDSEESGSEDNDGEQKKSSNRRRRRQRHTSPIAMGRSPTSEHPSVGAKKDKEKKNKNTSRKKRTTDKNKPPSRGLGDDPTDPEVRKKKLERLRQRKKRRPSSPGRRPTPTASSKNKRSTASRHQKTFNLGYKKFKDQKYKKALPHLQKAHEAKPDNALYKTIYAYCLFQVDSDEARKSVQLLRDAIDAQDRQSLPDAHLFYGHILKAKDREHRAYKHFKKALELNPASRDAEREVRLYERRHGKNGKKADKKSKKGKDSKSGGFFKKLFKE